MRTAGVILLAAAVLATASEAQESTPKFSAAYYKCEESAAGSDMAMTECASAESERQDKTLNSVYRELVTRVPPDAKQALIKSERAWLSFRDAQCDFEYQQVGGTSAHVVGTECELGLTIRRIEELNHSLDLERQFEPKRPKRGSK